MDIAVIGVGYVGLVTGVCLAEKGHTVVCVDIDPEKVKRINAGVPPIFEVHLEEMLKRLIGNRLRAETQLDQAIQESEITFIAVGTPFDGERIDLTYVKEVSRQIGVALSKKKTYHVVVVKSTVVPGTTDTVVLPLLEQHSGKKAGTDFGVGMNPEFLTEGQAIEDFMNPDRIVLGGIDDRSVGTLDRLYEGFPDTPKIRTNTRTAELIKYASNALLATMISFSNELADLCTVIGSIDITDVMAGVHASNYLSPLTPAGKRQKAPIASFLEAGCGFGGSCLPKDVKALSAHGASLGAQMRMLDVVIEINQARPQRVVSLLERHFPSLKGVRISILGLAFKPDTDDVRETPALPLIQVLEARGAIVKAYDPVAVPQARAVFGKTRTTFCNSLEDSLRDVEAVVLVTRWKQFERVPTLLAAMEKPPLFLDGRRMISKTAVPRYEGIGLS